MDNGKVAEVTSLQSVGYRYLKCGGSPEKVMACISAGYMLSLKFHCLKLKENWGSNIHDIKISLLKILTSGILQSAPNDLN